jgi:metalloendopeptidase OMA1, mitochondrial
MTTLKIRAAKALAAFAAVVAVVAACATAPVTGRRQLIMTSEAEEAALGLKAYQEATGGTALSRNAEWSARVARVGANIAPAADRPDFQWEFKLIAEPAVNAFCLPGGKVAFYEGIMPVCASDTGVAVVMGHEIGHAIARHGGERITQGMIAEQGVGVVAQIIGGKDQRLVQASAAALGAGVQYGAILPFSRKQESEADEIGLTLMAKAGYDPREAPRFWQRMIDATPGDRPAEWLSTHPDPANRIKALEALMPSALKIYEAASQSRR